VANGPVEAASFEEHMAVASNRQTAQAVTASSAPADDAPDKKSAPPELGKEQELSAFRLMLLIRRFEEKAGQLYGMGLIGGFCHLYIGQEAVVVGMQMTLKSGDEVITGYRDHGHMLACGMDPKGVMAELTGRQHGYSKGKGGSMHMFSPEKGFYGGHGIVGAQVRLAPGLPSPTGTGAMTTSRSPISATAPPIRGRSTRASTWRSYGSCRWST
jgi:pyruvate dehydrogenase E1 component alpha subunit